MLWHQIWFFFDFIENSAYLLFINRNLRDKTRTKNSLRRNRRQKKIRIMNENFYSQHDHKRKLCYNKKKFHIMSELLCSIILSTNFMKSFDITFKWRKKKKRDLMIIQKNHQIKIQITKTKFFLTKKINFFKSKFRSKKRQMNIYAKKFAVLNHDQKKNVKIKHKFLISENYVFESIQRIDLNLSSCFFKIHVVVSSDCDVMSMINFEKAFAKIYSEQFFERFWHFETFKFFVINIIFNYENVFFEKSIEANEMINFFELKSSEEESTLTFDVNKHWDEKYHVKIIQFLKNMSRYSDSN